MRLIAAFAVVLVALLAGCLDGQSSPQDVAPTITEQPKFGTVAGVVLDDEVMPIGNASVVVDGSGLEAVTDSGGAFWIDGVETGSIDLLVSHPRYEPERVEATVEAESVREVEVRLTLLPDLVPFNRTLIMEGKFDCAHEVPIWTGDCMILYDTYVAPVAGEDPVTEETFEFPVEIEPRWESVVLELVWDEPATNQLDGMRLYLEHGNLSMEGHSIKVARTDGPASPLSLRVERGEVKEDADVYPGTTTKAQLSPDGEQALVRVFPRGQLYDYTSQVCDSDGRCFLGFGAGLDIRFTVYATVFYNEAAPEGFSAIPAA